MSTSQFPGFQSSVTKQRFSADSLIADDVVVVYPEGVGEVARKLSFATRKTHWWARLLGIDRQVYRFVDIRLHFGIEMFRKDVEVLLSKPNVLVWRPSIKRVVKHRIPETS